MANLNDFSAVIFDMDGLVLDTESSYCLAWQKAALELGYRLSDSFCMALSGLPGPAIEHRLLGHLGGDLPLTVFRQLSSHYWQEHVSRHGIAVKHGVADWLNHLNRQQIPYCMATNSRLANALQCLQWAGMVDAFAMVISRDDVAEGKPDPAIFWLAAERLQVAITNCLVLEDSHTGIVAASRAGAFAAYIPSVLPADTAAIGLCDVMADDLAVLLTRFGGQTLVS